MSSTCPAKKSKLNTASLVNTTLEWVGGYLQGLFVLFSIDFRLGHTVVNVKQGEATGDDKDEEEAHLEGDFTLFFDGKNTVSILVGVDGLRGSLFL